MTWRPGRRRRLDPARRYRRARFTPILELTPEPLTAAAPPLPNRPSRESRAAVAFGIAFLFTLIVLATSPGALPATPPIRGAVALAGVLLGMLALLTALAGIASNRGWAVAAATPIVLLLVFAGAFELVWALTQGSITIPIAGLVGLWALQAPLRPAADPGPLLRRLGVPGALCVGAAAISVVWPIGSAFLLGAGGPFIVGQDALLPRLTVSCDGPAGSAPTAVRVAYDWHWARAEPMAAGDDSLTIEAATSRADGLRGYVLETNPTTSAGIWQSNIVFGGVSGITFGIDLALTRFEPASVGLGLAPPNALPTGHGSVEIKATYLHGPTDTNGPGSPAVWKSVTNARCQW